ncbi:transcription factor GTE4-like [Bidens hawaiensis]|uniref:transcription factor GTE4-like n=1 Tax=Bidens hawaiensis TaxID=980011 RepID=UPI00404A3B08
MDSGVLDADRISKEKSKWGEGNNNKVYTRRPKTTAVVAATDTVNNDRTVVVEPGPGPSDNNNNNDIDNNNEVEKPVVTVVDGWVKINIKVAKTKGEIVELKETMKTELERVRRLAQRVEDKEAELTAFSTEVVTDGLGYNGSRYSGNDLVDRRALLRVNSEMGASYTNSGIRPFRQLSVSVMNNNNHYHHHYGVGEFLEKEKRTPKANQYYRNLDFLLGKDRLPPETNKRRKSNSGRKVKVSNNMFKNCSNLLQRLMKHKHGWVFNEPVNAQQLGLHDYHDIIKHPMDLGTIKSRLAQNFYKSAMEFAEDVRLTFRNAMTYNPRGQDVHVMAEVLSEIFEERWALIEAQSNQDLRYGMIYDANTPTPTSRKVPHFAHTPARMLYRSESLNLPVLTRPTPAPAVRTPVPKKPKARDPNKRNMTYEEKQKLSTNLQSLPSEKLDSIVQIIKKNTSLSQQDGEIEVDIDSVDIETLWELDRFVMNYKKNLSKHKRKAALAEQARVEAGDVNQAVNPSTSFPEPLKENKTNETNRPSTPPNGSSSSSSSSDSGSSSSDSDSDSSSEDGSDAGHSPRT